MSEPLDYVCEHTDDLRCPIAMWTKWCDGSEGWAYVGDIAHALAKLDAAERAEELEQLAADPERESVNR